MSPHNRLLVPTGNRKRQAYHSLWRGWAAAFVVLAVLGFSGWVVYTHVIVPPIPIEERPVEVGTAPVPGDTPSLPRVAPEQRVSAIVRLATCGRNDAPARARALADSYPRWPDPILAAAACREIRVRMTGKQLRSAFGAPTRIVPSAMAGRPIETWYYGQKVSVILWDGIVKSWQ
jgi:hypothetical protein